MKFLLKAAEVIKVNIIKWKNKKKKITIGSECIIVDAIFGFKSQIDSNSIVIESVLNDFTKVGRCTSLHKVIMGKFSYVSFSSIISRTKIGKYCSIGPDCKIGLGRHPTCKFVSTHPAFFSSIEKFPLSFADKNYFNEFEQIVIGNDVWIGSNCILVDGITVGDGAVIGTGSVVTKNIPPYAIVGGVPAKIIRYRFEKYEIESLLEFKWWDKDVDWLKENFNFFHDINYFIELIEYSKK